MCMFYSKVRGQNILKNGQKLEKIENVITFGSFSLPQRCPLKIHIKTFSRTIKKIRSSSTLFHQLLENKLIWETKIPSF